MKVLGTSAQYMIQLAHAHPTMHCIPLVYTSVSDTVCVLAHAEESFYLMHVHTSRCGKVILHWSRPGYENPLPYARYSVHFSAIVWGVTLV